MENDEKNEDHKMVSIEDVLKSDDIFNLKIFETKEITKEMLRLPAWRLTMSLYNQKKAHGRPHVLNNVLGSICNAAIYHQQTEFLLSQKLLNAILAQDCHIKRKSLNGIEFGAFMSKAKVDKVLIEVSPPELTSRGALKNLAGRYRINIQEIVNYIATLVTDSADTTGHPTEHTTTMYEPMSETEHERESTQSPQSESLVPREKTTEHRNTFDMDLKPSEDDSDVSVEMDLEKSSSQETSGSGGEVVTSALAEEPSKYGDGRLLEPHRQEFLTVTGALASSIRFPTEQGKYSSCTEAMIEVFSEEFSSWISHYSESINNEYRDTCGTRFPEPSLVKEALDNVIENRFKDKEGIWAKNSEVVDRLRSSVSRRYDRLIEGAKRIYIPKRNGTPEEWLVFKAKSDELESKREAAFYKFIETNDSSDELAWLELNAKIDQA